MTGLYAIAERSDVEFHGQAVLAVLSAGRFELGHGQGVSDAAFSRGYGETRASSADRRDYALGYHLGRYLLFAGLPRWRSPVNPATAQETLEAFKLSAEGGKFTAQYGEPFPAELSPAQLEALGDWNAGSVGGRALLDGWRGFMAGEPCPSPAWPYLRGRGWHAAKAHCVALASRAEASGRSLSHDSDSRREVRAIAGERATLLGAQRFAAYERAAHYAQSLEKAARLGFVIRAHVESARWDLRRAADIVQERLKESES